MEKKSVSIVRDKMKKKKFSTNGKKIVKDFEVDENDYSNTYL